MNYFKLFSTLLLFSILFQACKKDNTIVPAQTKKDVYLAGYISDASLTKTSAAFWKNNTITILDNSAGNSKANGILLSGNDVYVVGTIADINYTREIAVYWKNSIAIPLSGNLNYANGTALTVNGKDIYVAGQEQQQGDWRYVAKYWKNGVEFNLSDGSKNCSAARIAVEGNDVYIAGYEELKKDFNVPVYWKNGVKQFSSKEMILGHAPLISVSKDNIYFISSLFYAYEDLYLKNNQNFYFCGKPYLHANAIKLVGK